MAECAADEVKYGFHRAVNLAAERTLDSGKSPDRRRPAVQNAAEIGRGENEEDDDENAARRAKRLGARPDDAAFPHEEGKECAEDEPGSVVLNGRPFGSSGRRCVPEPENTEFPRDRLEGEIKEEDQGAGAEGEAKLRQPGLQLEHEKARSHDCCKPEERKTIRDTEELGAEQLRVKHGAER